MAQGYLYRNGAKALFLLFTSDNPSRCVQSRDCTHTIDGRELTNRHNSIRELLMHMCVCCCLPRWHRVTCIATVQKHYFSYSRMSIQAVVFNRGIARTQSMGANSQIVTIAFESY